MSTKKRAPKKINVDYRQGKIYKLVNDVDDMIYVGSTSSSLSRRFSNHKYAARTVDTNIYTAMRTTGVDHFRIILIELFPCTCKAELEAREYAVMKGFPQDKLYNSMRDGKHDAASKQKIKDNSFNKGKLGAAHPTFARGCIYETTTARQSVIVFRWWQDKVRQAKSFTYGGARTREMAYLACMGAREEIYPLTTKEYLQELPFFE